MSNVYADLHCHSTASDGSDPPFRVVERAKSQGLAAIALTDHDTVDGVAEAQEAGAKLGVEVIAGTELTCYVDGREVHVLGYGMDISSQPLAAHCAKFQEARITRAHTIGARLAELGVPIDMNAVMASADGGVVGRPHVARALIDAGHVRDWDEAFTKYLGAGKPADAPKLIVTAEEVVAVIKQAGGIAVMAHPALGNQYDLIPVLKKAGAVGVEVWHSAHDKRASDKIDQIAMQHGLLKTGGSDCHGEKCKDGPILGQWGVDKPRFEKFLEALARLT